MADTRTMVRIVRVLTAALVALGLGGILSAPAWAARARSSSGSNFAGTYNGLIAQSQPKSFTGHIHFVVSNGKLTDLKFTVGAICGVVWLEDKDHSVPSFPVKIGSAGTFAYRGTVGGRQIRLKGAIKANKATGTFFTAFSLSKQTRCTMGQAASFSATR
jgi:hypothetical protein